MTELLPAAPATTAGAAPRVLGLDLSLRSTGIAYPDGMTNAVRTRHADGDLRLSVIRRTVESALSLYAPGLAVIEDLPTHAHSAGITGMVHGVVRSVLADHRVPVALIAPATLKAYAVGNGAATKAVMLTAAETASGQVMPWDDEADAWWLRAAGLDWLGHPVVTVPQAQRDRLSKAKWPVEAVTS